ncbi:hypothetical protein HP439_13025 [Sphingobacterium shayense]|uniref:hypothetical protein n=1 Tax=Sphingobacterium shayense TaxID=626343 RepID=UPI0015525351|nr:hypothetical protein [Sphingobacterium shayense]NQD71645.1 hypothetical protein [Sphingobacterium shayense]
MKQFITVLALTIATLFISCEKEDSREEAHVYAEQHLLKLGYTEYIIPADTWNVNNEFKYSYSFSGTDPNGNEVDGTICWDDPTRIFIYLK